MRRVPILLLAAMSASTLAVGDVGEAERQPEPYVVVATLDTGANPFHPTWQRDQFDHPSEFIPGYPETAEAVDLTIVEDDFQASVDASKPELAKFGQGLTWVRGTNIIGTWTDPADSIPIFDVTGTSHGHGAQASSQIAGTGYGLAPDAYIVIMDRTVGAGSASAVYRANADGLRWAADQPWIDIIHTNIQNPVPLANAGTPLYPGYADAVAYAVSKGKLVVSAGGNFYAEFTETSPHAGPPGVLVAGANDNCGWTEFSNPDPHVSMDGARTVSAEPRGFGDGSFGGTSSASPRITGYAANLLLQLRRTYGDVAGFRDEALLVLDETVAAPSTGPLADGRLTALELHEVIRKTARPDSHPSMWDGAQATTCIPEPPSTAGSWYAKVGYGEVSEHTTQAALDVLLGNAPMPARPTEDLWFAASETARGVFWPSE